MKLKTDESGNVVVQDGKPVYVYPDGKEVAVDAPQMFQKISALNNENKQHREKAEAVQSKLEQFGDLSPEDARKLAEEISALGGLETIRKGSRVNTDEIKAELSRAYETKLADKDRVIQEKEGHIYKLEVSNRFKSSSYVNDKLILPPDIAEATFGKSFKVEDGRVVAYLDGNRIYSREKPGELAGFDEAITTIIEAYPAKDRILKGTGNSGGGAQNSAAKTGITTLDALYKLPPAERIAAAKKAGFTT